jgi:SOS response regulatory protein OraA/RecX
MSAMTREEHLAWAKRRALQYLDARDLAEAFTSMASDLSKHPELQKIEKMMSPLGLLYVMNGDARQLRAWIEGFN